MAAVLGDFLFAYELQIAEVFELLQDLGGPLEFMKVGEYAARRPARRRGVRNVIHGLDEELKNSRERITSFGEKNDPVDRHRSEKTADGFGVVERR